MLNLETSMTKVTTLCGRVAAICGDESLQAVATRCQELQQSRRDLINNNCAVPEALDNLISDVADRVVAVVNELAETFNVLADIRNYLCAECLGELIRADAGIGNTDSISESSCVLPELPYIKGGHVDHPRYAHLRRHIVEFLAAGPHAFPAIASGMRETVIALGFDMGVTACQKPRWRSALKKQVEVLRRHKVVTLSEYGYRLSDAYIDGKLLPASAKGL